MTVRPHIRRRSLARARLVAAAPRAALYALVAILALAGVRAIARPAPAPPRAPRVVASPDLAAEAFAQSFVRAYLTWGSSQDAYDAAVGAYLAESLAIDSELVVTQHAPRRVVWTQPVADDPTPGGRRTIVVEAQTDAGTDYVAVPVSRSGGALVVSAYPALVGPPPANTHAQPPPEQDVTDTDLQAVVRRAVANYLSGETSNLRADLTPGAAAAPPPTEPLALHSLDRLSWAGPGVVAAELTATSPDGTVWTLRYELRVVKRDRWYVAAVEVNPEGGDT